MKLTKKSEYNQRKRVGNLVGSFLNHFGATSVETLTQHVKNRSNQSMEYIHAAVQRSLRYGTRHGFLVKQKNNYSMSNRNYEADGDANEESGEEGERYVKEGKIVDWSQIYTNEFNACKSNQNKLCGFNFKRMCASRDFFTGSDCNNKTFKTFKYCNMHIDSKNILTYRIMFTKNFDNANLDAILMADDAIKNRIIKQRDITANHPHLLAEEAAARKDLGKYLQNFIAYFYQERPQDHDLIIKILNRTLYIPSPNGCNGMDITNGLRCNKQLLGTQISGLCYYHHYMRTLSKAFSRSEAKKENYFDYKPGRYIDAVWYTTVELFFSQIIINQDELRNNLRHAGACSRYYMAAFFRYDIHNICPVKIEIVTFFQLILLIFI